LVKAIGDRLHEIAWTVDALRLGGTTKQREIMHVAKPLIPFILRERSTQGTAGEAMGALPDFENRMTKLTV
jgi:hypothetical protein